MDKFLNLFFLIIIIKSIFNIINSNWHIWHFFNSNALFHYFMQIYNENVQIIITVCMNALHVHNELQIQNSFKIK